MVVYIYRMNIKDKFYIGSTKDIKYRIQKHKYSCYNQNPNKPADSYNCKVYKYIRDNCDDWSEVSFQILDVYDDISKKFRLEIEDYYIKYFNNNLNMRDAKLDKEKRAITDKKRREESRKKVLCECGRIVNLGGIWSHKKTKIHQELLNK